MFHNLKNCVSHLILRKVNELNEKLNRNKKIDVVVQNSDKFITFSFGYFQFKHSVSFLSASLDKLVKLNKYEGMINKSLNKSKDRGNNFKYTKTNPYIKTKTDLEVFTEKLVYRYDYMDTCERFEETKNYLRNSISIVSSTKLVSLTKITQEPI